MKVNELIEKLKKEDPNGSENVCTANQYDIREGNYLVISDFLIEEDNNGDLSVVIIGDDWSYPETKTTTQELITKLNQLNPDGQAKVYVRYNGNTKDFNETIDTILYKRSFEMVCLCSWC